jgi:nicotinamidase-related amidase
VHVRHANEGPTGRFRRGAGGFQPKPESQERPGERVLVKTVNSAFIGTDLREILTDYSRGVVFVGLTTDHCVSTTVRMASNLGFSTAIVSDATATFERVGPDGRQWTAEEMHASARASLSEEFAPVRTTQQILAEAAMRKCPTE